MAKSAAYPAYIEERFQGEVYGEALFRAMAENTSDPERARKLRVLEQLERETKERLRPAVREVGHSGADDLKRVKEGESLGARLGQVPWQGLMQSFVPELEKFVREFEEGEPLAPPGKEDLLRRVTDHERALLEFARRESDADSGLDSLEPVLALLEEPGDG